MPFPTESPYEILDISPSANLAEIMKAFAHAQRTQRYPVPKLTRAFNDLRNPRKRAEHDLFVFMNLGDSNTINAFMKSLVMPTPITPDVEPFPLPPLIPLRHAASEQDFSPLPAPEMEFQSITSSDQVEIALPPLIFAV